MSAIVDIRSTFGAVFVGLFVSTILYGVTLTQTPCRERDPKALKCFIALLVAMDTLHSILCFYIIYWYLILNYGNVASLEDNMWLKSWSIPLSASPYNSFMRDEFISVGIPLATPHSSKYDMITSPNRTGMGTRWIYKSYSRYQDLIRSSFGGCSDCRVDVLVSLPLQDRVGEASSCLVISTAELSLPSVYRTDSIIVTLMVYSISTGLLTRLMPGIPIAPLVLDHALWRNFAAVFLDVRLRELSPCYVRSIFTFTWALTFANFRLNNRDLLRGQSTSAATKTDGTFAMTDPSRSSYGSKTIPATVAVTVHRTPISESESDLHAAGKHDYIEEPSFLEVENAV
ncbi:hypothetical protein BJV74DRAFT_902229 [Russula compacta]|nr:hypothetical protein BJV74DRAFT_902229 [Russula compacta]